MTLYSRPCFQDFNHRWLRIRQNYCTTEFNTTSTPDADKDLLDYGKGPFKAKYQLLINGREKVRFEHEKMPKTLLII